MISRQHSLNRRGAVIVEGAVVLGVALLVLFAILDLGLAVLHYNALSEGARRVARAAIVRGAMAEPAMTAWGPKPFTGTGASESEIAASLQPALAAIDPSRVTLQVEWLDGDNQPGDRVQVTVSESYLPVVPFFSMQGAIQLRAVSSMRIQH